MTCARNDCDKPAVWTVVPAWLDHLTDDWKETRWTVGSCHAHLPDTLNWMSEHEAAFLVRAIDGPGWKE